MSQKIENKIKVVCRFRPLNDKEDGLIFSDSENVVSFAGKNYSFDKVFKPHASQETVYNEAVKPIVSDVLLNGCNGTIFAYGQTSSGKTHTMEGVTDDAINRGIIPRIVDEIFNHIDGKKEIKFCVKVSYYEIYMEKVNDLLNTNKTNLQIFQDKNQEHCVIGATEQLVSTREEVLKAFLAGKKNRHIADTSMNEYSSRSHAVFVFMIFQENLQSRQGKAHKLFLADLAGSENLPHNSDSVQSKESSNINKSLLELSKVIQALNTKNSYPTYRASKLTRILKESLGGNSKTTIILCCSSGQELQTKSTLEFGLRASNVKNVVCANKELAAAESEGDIATKRFKEVIEELQKENAILKAVAEENKYLLAAKRLADETVDQLRNENDKLKRDAKKRDAEESTSESDEEEPIYERDPNVYKVVKALNCRKFKGKKEYLINWQHSWIRSHNVTKDIRDAYDNDKGSN